MKSLIVTALLASAATAVNWNACPVADMNCDCDATTAIATSFATGATGCGVTPTGKYAKAVCDKEGSMNVRFFDAADTTCSGTVGTVGPTVLVPYNQCLQHKAAGYEAFLGNPCKVQWEDCASATDASCVVNAEKACIRTAVRGTANNIDSRATCGDDGTLTINFYSSTTGICRGVAASTFTVPYTERRQTTAANSIFVQNHCRPQFETHSGASCAVAGTKRSVINSCNENNFRSTCQIDGTLALTSCKVQNNEKWSVHVPKGQCYIRESTSFSDMPKYITNHCPNKWDDACDVNAANNNVMGHCYAGQTTGNGHIGTCLGRGVLQVDTYVNAKCTGEKRTTTVIDKTAGGPASHFTCLTNGCETTKWGAGCSNTFGLAAKGVADETCVWTSTGLCSYDSVDVDSSNLIGDCDRRTGLLTVRSYPLAGCAGEPTVVARVPYATAQEYKAGYIKNACPLPTLNGASSASMVASAVALFAVVAALF